MDRQTDNISVVNEPYCFLLNVKINNKKFSMCITFIAVPETYKTVDPKTEVLIVNFVYQNNTKQVKTQ